MSAPKHTAAAASAGYIFQLERALHHLGSASRNAVVAVEYVDDLAVLDSGKTILQEQDKHSLQIKPEILGDRSPALWRTLQIWLAPAGEAVTTCSRYLLVVNHIVTTPIASMLKASRSDVSAKEIVQALRIAGKDRKSAKSKIQTIIDDVLSKSDEALAELIGKIEIVEWRNSSNGDRAELANRFGIDPRMDADVVLDALQGWMTRHLLQAWREGRPGLVSRSACVRQCREIEDLQARKNLLPRAARDIPVADVDKDRAMARPFVHHLNRIAAEEDDVLAAIEHFIRFSAEKYRLVGEGGIADREWADRGDRLRQRWANIVRSTKRDFPNHSAETLGIKILERSTYDHFEPLGVEPCRELYMTSGHYHRLADDDEVWWHPDYRPKQTK